MLDCLEIASCFLYLLTGHYANVAKDIRTDGLITPQSHTFLYMRLSHFLYTH